MTRLEADLRIRRDELSRLYASLDALLPLHSLPLPGSLSLPPSLSPQPSLAPAPAPVVRTQPPPPPSPRDGDGDGTTRRLEEEVRRLEDEVARLEGAPAPALDEGEVEAAESVVPVDGSHVGELPDREGRGPSREGGRTPGGGAAAPAALRPGGGLDSSSSSDDDDELERLRAALRRVLREREGEALRWREREGALLRRIEGLEGERERCVLLSAPSSSQNSPSRRPHG